MQQLLPEFAKKYLNTIADVDLRRAVFRKCLEDSKPSGSPFTMSESPYFDINYLLKIAPELNE